MKAIYIIALCITMLVAAASFIVSYSTMESLAAEHGLKAAWLFPIAIDGCLVIATVSRLFFSITGKKSMMPVTMLCFFVIVSVILNAIEAYPDLIGAFIYGMAPICLLASGEMTAELIRKECSRPAKKARVITRRTPDESKESISTPITLGA